MRLGLLKCCLTAAGVATYLAPQPALAGLAITEVASTSGAPDVLAGLDWWELTNTGPASVSLDGYEWEDNNPQGPGADTAVFPNGIFVAPGESIIIHQGDGIASAFRTAWGLPNSVQVLEESLFGGNNTFSGLSSSGDQVRIYDPMGTEVSVVSFPASTSGVTFEWNTSGMSLGLSVSGEHGAHLSTYGGIGSPGFAVPEPAAIVLFGTAIWGLAGFSSRRRRSTN